MRAYLRLLVRIRTLVVLVLLEREFSMRSGELWLVSSLWNLSTDFGYPLASIDFARPILLLLRLIGSALNRLNRCRSR